MKALGVLVCLNTSEHNDTKSESLVTCNYLNFYKTFRITACIMCNSYTTTTNCNILHHKDPLYQIGEKLTWHFHVVGYLEPYSMIPCILVGYFLQNLIVSSRLLLRRYQLCLKYSHSYWNVNVLLALIMGSEVCTCTGLLLTNTGF